MALYLEEQIGLGSDGRQQRSAAAATAIKRSDHRRNASNGTEVKQSDRQENKKTKKNPKIYLNIVEDLNEQLLFTNFSVRDRYCDVGTQKLSVRDWRSTDKAIYRNSYAF